LREAFLRTGYGADGVPLAVLGGAAHAALGRGEPNWRTARASTPVTWAR